MNRQEAIALFGSAIKLAEALGYTSRHAVYMWKKDKPIPERAYLKIRYELRPECFGPDGELLPEHAVPRSKERACMNHALSAAARTTDPVSSRLAADEHTASGKRGKHIGIVIDAVRRHPGKTSAELAPLCGLERHDVARRTADAEHAGAIRKGEIRRCNTSGRSAVTWWPA